MKKILSGLLLSFFTIVSFAQAKTIQERLGYPKDAKLVIIHADDLGVSHSETSASIFAMEKGSVSSASIMVPCPWFPEIAAYAQSHPQADLGLHLTLTSEWKNYKWGPVTPVTKVPGLVNEKGFLYSSVDSLLRSARPGEMEEEIRNQVKRAIQFGVDPTHLDAHMAGAFSSIDFLKSYIKVGHEFKVPVFLTRYLETLLKIKLDSLINDKDVIVDAVTATPDDFKKGFNNYYTGVIRNLKPGISYLIIHTAYDNDEMKAVTVDHPDWGSAWRQADFDFFTSATCAKLLKDNNIVVITWKEIRDKITRQ
jgi:chitin disaccharide deacetylase